MNEPLPTIKREKRSKKPLYWRETRKEKDKRIEIEKESQKKLKKESGSKITKGKSNYRGYDQNPAIQNYLFIFSLIILM